MLWWCFSSFAKSHVCDSSKYFNEDDSYHLSNLSKPTSSVCSLLIVLLCICYEDIQWELSPYICVIVYWLVTIHHKVTFCYTVWASICVCLEPSAIEFGLGYSPQIFRNVTYDLAYSIIVGISKELHLPAPYNTN